MTKPHRDPTQCALRFAPDVVFITEANGNIVFANDNALLILGYSLTELLKMSVLDISPPDWRDTYAKKLAQMVDDGLRHTEEIRLIPKSGQKIPMELSIVMMPNGLLYGACRDISERKQSEAKLKELNKNLSALIETIPDPIFLKDGEGRWLLINEPAKKLFDLQQIDWYRKTDLELADLQPDFRPAYEGCVKDDLLAWKKGGLLITEEYIPDQHGDIRTMEVLKMPTFESNGQRKGLVIIGRDITEHKRAQQRIHELAYYDPLTQLPNRRLLIERIEHTTHASVANGQYGALLLLDLDHFKSFSSACGDQLLREIAKRLNENLPDGHTVACVGGDEFVVLIESLSSYIEHAAEFAERHAKKLCTLVNLPFHCNGLTIRSTASIGITLLLGQQDAAEDLIKQAKVAVVQAKSAGRNAIHFFNPAIQSTLNARNALEHDLRYALEHQQFELYYQTQVDSHQRILGAEVLLRWNHPSKGILAPTSFIDVCEESGLIIPIGQWVLETACRQLKVWQKHPQLRDLQLSINVSAKQFYQLNFVSQIKRTLLESGAKPSQIKLELTESSMLKNVEDTVSKMNELKLMGVRFSLDDFGTGHSSLLYLKRLPLDQIKIDQSFVRDISTDLNDAVIVKAIISMSDAMGLNVIAEGVETVAQRDFLDAHGCHVFQGYLFSRPMPLSDFEALLPDEKLPSAQ
jgi:diguanylate cyclase (GGDEF)-like protein/PAS domain S-box-containing protein